MHAGRYGGVETVRQIVVSVNTLNSSHVVRVNKTLQENKLKALPAPKVIAMQR